MGRHISDPMTQFIGPAVVAISQELGYFPDQAISDILACCPNCLSDGIERADVLVLRVTAI